MTNILLTGLHTFLVVEVRRIHSLMLKLFLFLYAGLQHGIVHTGCPFGLPLNVTTLPQKLKEVGENLDLNSRIYIL